MMVALEDGVVSPQDSFYVGTGRYQYKGKWVNDHYYRQGRDRGYLTVNEGMSISSNIVLAKTILKGYEDNPAKYVQHLHDLGITRKIDWDVPLKGKEGTVQIRFPNDKAHYWSKTTLPWMAFGYETQVPPIYMLMFYNGIANNGTMIKPFLTKAFVGNGKIEKSFSTEVINPSLCSDRTLKEIQSMLVDAINKGTGKPAKCDDFQVAGKTGTALLASGGGYSGYYVSFCGYFPADKPKYTIFVGVRRPQAPPSGGLISGVVFKKIAEEIYARNTYITPEQCKPDTLAPKAPHLKNGLFKQAKMVLDELNIPYTSPDKGVLWVSAEAQADKVGLQKANVREDLVPNVHGMGAKDALFALEKAGLRVSVRGYGRVAEQSLPPGTKASKGAWIVLDLK
jgi:cell division protein FtsI (penicillin-binding protein 3)